MKNLKLLDKVSSLPAKQQIALWVILKKFNKKGKVYFSVSDFADEMKKYLISKDAESLGKIIGGVLSSLVRNGMIKQLTGGRDTIWTVDSELQTHAREYVSAIFPVVTYWDNK
jgi:hypothetical protein